MGLARVAAGDGAGSISAGTISDCTTKSSARNAVDQCVREQARARGGAEGKAEGEAEGGAEGEAEGVVGMREGEWRLRQHLVYAKTAFK
jgi:hypothetical protein